MSRELGVSDDDIRRLKKARVLRAVMYCALPVVGLALGYAVSMLMFPRAADDGLPSTYPLAVAAASQVPMIRNRVHSDSARGFSILTAVLLMAIAFMFGLLLRAAAYTSEEEGAIRYGVHGR